MKRRRLAKNHARRQNVVRKAYVKRNQRQKLKNENRQVVRP